MARGTLISKKKRPFSLLHDLHDPLPKVTPISLPIIDILHPVLIQLKHVPRLISSPIAPVRRTRELVRVGIQVAHKRDDVLHHQRDNGFVVRPEAVGRRARVDAKDGGRLKDVRDAEPGGRVVVVLDVEAVGPARPGAVGGRVGVHDGVGGADEGRLAVGLAGGREPDVVVREWRQQGVLLQHRVGFVLCEFGVIICHEGDELVLGRDVGGEDGSL